MSGFRYVFVGFCVVFGVKNIWEVMIFLGGFADFSFWEYFVGNFDLGRFLCLL